MFDIREHDKTKQNTKKEDFIAIKLSVYEQKSQITGINIPQATNPKLVIIVKTII